MKRKISFLVGMTALVIILFQGCAMYSAGKAYTFAKEDRTHQLVKTEKILTSTKDNYDQKISKDLPHGTLKLVLNSGFLRYLEAIQQPEVVIFSKVIINPNQQVLNKSGKSSNVIEYKKIILSSQDNSTHMVQNKNSFLPIKDIEILPPIVYTGETIRVELRVIELDQADNVLLRQIINVAASTAAGFETTKCSHNFSLPNCLNFSHS